MSNVDPFTRSAHEDRGTFENDPTAEELDMLELRHREEGHYIVAFNTSFEHEHGQVEYEPVWYARCTCGEGNFCGPEGPVEDEPLMLHTVDGCRRWARAHREEHGLPWQPWLGNRGPVLHWARFWEAVEGHCVCAMDLEDSIRVACTCGRDMLVEVGEERAAERAQDADFRDSTATVATYNDAVLWAAEHRGRSGLDPQPALAGFGVLVHGGAIYLRP
jgi:hypothetical protein